jgi:putative redox protein
MALTLEASAKLVNQKVGFIASAGNNQPVAFDYPAPIGDGEGYTGLQGLLISLAACAGTAVLHLLRKQNKTVDALQVNAIGTRREVHPTSLSRIEILFTITANDISENDAAEAIRLAEETISPVWAMIRGNAEIISNCRIIRQSA